MRIKLISLVIVLAVISRAAFSITSINYIKAHNMRLSSTKGFSNWIKGTNNKTNEKYIYILPAFSYNPKIRETYKQFESEELYDIASAINNSYRKPYDAEAKLAIGWRMKNFEQNISSNAASIFSITNPVFPRLNAFVFHDYTLSSYYNYTNQKLNIKTGVHVIKRKYLDKSYSVGDILDEKIKVKYGEIGWNNFSELSVDSSYVFLDKLDLYLLANSVPLFGNFNYKYGELRFGTNYFIGHFKFIDKLRANLNFSPLYQGDYSFINTVQYGVTAQFASYFSINLFANQGKLPGCSFILNFKYLNLSVGTFQRSMDSHHGYGSRQYHLNLRASY